MRALFFFLIAAPLIGASPRCYAQAIATPTIQRSEHYAPLNGAQRWRRWLNEDGASSPIYLQSIAAASYMQLFDDPNGWNRNSRGFIRRAGDSFVGIVVQNTVHEGMAAAAGTDPRYSPCKCTGFFSRSGHALKMTFLTNTRNGHLTVDLPQFSGIYAGSMTESMWWPHHYSATVQGMQSGHLQVGLTAVIHLVQEFSPELKRLFHKPAQ